MEPQDLLDVSALEKSSQIRSGQQRANDATTVPAGVAILMHDPVFQRLIESASQQLDLQTVLLPPDSPLDATQLGRFELIVADRLYAASIRSTLQRELRGEGVNPAVIAAISNQQTTQALDPALYGFDAVIYLPQLPAPLAAQLSVILYAHRAFALRYESAMEELNLNRRIFRSVTSGISVANGLLPDCPLTYVNPAFEAMTGYSFEDVQGKNCRFLQGTERDEATAAQIRRAIHLGRELTVVLKNCRKDGSIFWNELSLSPIRSREGQVTHFVGIQTDVTARVEIEAALRESEKLAAVGRLASTIAHEINNPLESVMNLVYLAERSETLEQVREYLATADRELQRVKLITAQSLRFFKQSTRPIATAATPLVESVLDLYQPRLHNANITVEHRARESDTILCMESEIRQVLNNLVSNAIDAMSMGDRQGGWLRVRSRNGSHPRTGRPGLIITVADTGSGMAPETLKSIYRAFYTTKGIGGTGLGLWISSEIITRHKGRLLVRSSTQAQSHGTVFMLFLPREGTSGTEERA